LKPETILLTYISWATSPSVWCLWDWGGYWNCDKMWIIIHWLNTSRNYC